MRAAARGLLALILTLSAVPGGGIAQSGPVAERFAAAVAPAPGPARAIGGHAGGCLSGAEPLAPRGRGWAVARPERGRHWAHPRAIAFVEHLADAAAAAGWPGLAIGDIAQPRGGPMPSGHRSHQTGLDIDILFRPLGREAAPQPARSMVGPGGRTLAPHWRAGHARLLELAARAPGVDRIFVNPAIKAGLCRSAPAQGRGWLRRIRPWWGHDAHFHVRLACPGGETACEMQPPPPPGDGCDATLAWWFTPEALSPATAGVRTAAPRRAELPAACGALAAP